MNERKYFILGAILSSYLHSKEPLGSRTLKRLYNMDISAATIRNEMSDLELLGYLEKTHVSSGRIPSQKAYRWYVDQVQEKGWAREEVPQLPDRSLLTQTDDPRNVLDSALNVLSDITGTAAFTYTPGRGNDRLSKIRFLPLSDREILILLVFHSKFIQTERVHLKGTYAMDRLFRAEEIFQNLLEGKNLDEITIFLQTGPFSGTYVAGNLLSELVPVVRDRIVAHRKPNLVFNGLFKLLALDDYAPDKALVFIQKLQDDPDLLDFLAGLDNQDGMKVYIGQENPVDWLKDASLIMVPYRVRGDIIGQLGVVGPIDMDYRRVMSDVYRMGRYINAITGRQ